MTSPAQNKLDILAEAGFDPEMPELIETDQDLLPKLIEDEEPSTTTKDDGFTQVWNILTI